MSCDLKNKFEEWKVMLVEDDLSIFHQIRRMLWDYAVFQSINEARKDASKNSKGESELNGIVHRFIDFCFFSTQALGIRKLIDDPDKHKDKRKGINSLKRLICDMELNCNLLTRENIIAIYDNYCNNPREVSNQTYGTILDSIQKKIDYMLGIDASQRKADDYIPNEVFAWLKDKLGIEEFKKIKDFTNKYVAHAADPESRKGFEDISIYLDEIKAAHKSLYETMAFIGENIFFSMMGPMTVPFGNEHDQFEYFESPMATKETVKKLGIIWAKYRTETEEWSKRDWWKDLKDIGEKIKSKKNKE